MTHSNEKSTVRLFRYKKNRAMCGIMLLPDGKILHTLEPLPSGNIRNTSHIPSGIYQVEYLPNSASGKYRDVYWVKGVAKRNGILIHKGNLITHTTGCILVGKSSGTYGGTSAVWNSGSAINELHLAVSRSSFLLEIT